MLPALITAGSSLLGGVMANNARSAAADTQMDFQERMSSTAYQRGMEDMRKAGLNPILAYKQGGASSPAGAMPVLQDVMTPAVSTGLQTMQTISNTELQETQSKLNQVNEALRKNLLPASDAIATITTELGVLLNKLNNSSGGVEGITNAIGQQIFETWKYLNGPEVQQFKQQMSDKLQNASDAVKGWWNDLIGNDEGSLHIDVKSGKHWRE